LHDEPEFGPEYDLWLDKLAWEAGMKDALDGCELEPRSTPITDDDIAVVNAVG
jgi:hypothetical protein